MGPGSGERSPPWPPAVQAVQVSVAPIPDLVEGRTASFSVTLVSIMSDGSTQSVDSALVSIGGSVIGRAVDVRQLVAQTPDTLSLGRHHVLVTAWKGETLGTDSVSFAVVPRHRSLLLPLRVIDLNGLGVLAEVAVYESSAEGTRGDRIRADTTDPEGLMGAVPLTDSDAFHVAVRTLESESNNPSFHFSISSHGVDIGPGTLPVITADNVRAAGFSDLGHAAIFLCDKDDVDGDGQFGVMFDDSRSDCVTKRSSIDKVFIYADRPGVNGHMLTEDLDLLETLLLGEGVRRIFGHRPYQVLRQDNSPVTPTGPGWVTIAVDFDLSLEGTGNSVEAVDENGAGTGIVSSGQVLLRSRPTQHSAEDAWMPDVVLDHELIHAVRGAGSHPTTSRFKPWETLMYPSIGRGSPRDMTGMDEFAVVVGEAYGPGTPLSAIFSKHVPPTP